jgi:D-serine dehydratase
MQLDATSKGMPVLASGPASAGEIRSQGWNLLRGDLVLPVLALNDRAFRHNLAVLKRMATKHGVVLAPHGKTSMCPDLFREQLTDGGSWGLAAATVQQAAVMARYGVPRVLIANQVIGRANVHLLADLKVAYPDVSFWTFVDSLAAVDQLHHYGAHRLDPSDRFRVMIELGYRQGRTGCRSPDELWTVAEYAWAMDRSLSVEGVSFYEGTIGVAPGEETAAPAVSRFLNDVRQGCERLLPEILARTDRAIVTGGGSAYFDIVLSKLGDLVGKRTDLILRGACYFTGDHGYYARMLQELDQRSGVAGSSKLGMQGSEIRPALELVSYVQSLNDPGVAIVTMGLRDMPCDLGFPIPIRQYRDGRLLDVCGPGWTVVKSNDQHCYMHYPIGSDIAVGDIFSFGVSHPCTAFDKWRLFFRVNDEYNVIDVHETFF